MDRQEAWMETCKSTQCKETKRQEPRVEIQDDFGDSSDVDEDAIIKDEIRRMRNRSARFERKGRNNVGAK